MKIQNVPLLAAPVLWIMPTTGKARPNVLLILQIPGQKPPGARSDALVELVDVLPTLTEACDLALAEGTEGDRLLPLMNDPEGNANLVCDPVHRDHIPTLTKQLHAEWKAARPD